MKTTSVLMLVFATIASFAQVSPPCNFAILKTDYGQGMFRVFYENWRVENLIDSMKPEAS